MQNKNLKIIGIVNPPKTNGHWQMLNALGDIFEVRFEQRSFIDDRGVDAWYLEGTDRKTLEQIKRIDSPYYATLDEDQLVACGGSSAIHFARHPVLPVVLHGRQIINEEVAAFKAIPQWSGYSEVLASKGGSPVWVIDEFQGHVHHLVAMSPPELNAGEFIFQHFCGRRFLRLLPLISFLQGLNADQRWASPPLMSCFMFDDPNIHWRTYGFINFEEIARDAQKHNYHVSFATVPIDSWFVHGPTAALFRRSPERLSLLIHGNDHLARELNRADLAGNNGEMLRQALDRIGRLERRSQTEVSRVMAPPHGVYCKEVLSDMARLGYEGACIPRGALSKLIDKTDAPLNQLGMAPADIIEGLPVLSRFPLTANCHTNILIAAMLNQPIIPTGHHEDVAQGLRLLEDISHYINSLGAVKWASMTNIFRALYASKIDGRNLHIKMSTKRIEVSVPEGINQILMERPWLPTQFESEPLAWRFAGRTEWVLHYPERPINVIPGQIIEIIAEVPKKLSISTRDIRQFRFWPLVRRQLAEARDRISPVLRCVSNFSTKQKVK